VLRYVMRTHEAVVLDDASAPNQFSADYYVQKIHPKSMLCLPLLKQTELIGVLYLENDLAPYAFSPNKMELLELLASQAAISLENARLYADLRQRRAQDEATRKAREELTRMARLTTLGELTASIAHEVNQPLMAIVTNAGACLNWLAADNLEIEEVRHAVERIVRDGHRAGEIVTTIRGLTKKTVPEMKPLIMNAVITDVLELLRVELRQNSISLEIELSEEVQTVLGDRTQLQQVMLNLIMNAIDAMKHELAPHILRILSRLNTSGHLLVEIADSGAGLDPATANQVFEPFFTTKAGGLGLGLSICQSIIESHGGRLWPSENIPRGSIFSFTIPV
jgi:C4-dicarboxylate-specific signal transduction histidine kinase